MDQPPTTPASFSAVATSSDSISLAWAASADDHVVAGYRLYRGGSLVRDAAQLSHVDVDLAPATAYCYQVLAYDDAGNQSALSPERCATTLTAGSYSLTVAKSGTGSGTVTSSPAGISCGATCAAPFASGTSVTLTAAPAAGSTFAGWSGCDSAAGTTCTVSTVASKAVTAAFDVVAASYTLTVAKSGTGSGTVTSSPAGISCGAACAAPFASGTSVTLTAAPAAGSTFAGWSGGGCAGLGTCTTTMAAATSVTATFTLQQFTLTVAKSGAGSGTVTSSPAGISCGATCAAPFASGTSVTLTATPAAGSTFAGWSGGGCAGLGTCTTTMTAATSVTATFAIASQTVTFSPIASNMLEANSLDASAANTVFQNYYPPVGINSFWNLAGGASQAFAAMVKFDVASLAGKTIESATLQMTANSISVGYYPVGFQVGTVASTWSPATVTWNVGASLLYYTSTWQRFSRPTYSGQVFDINVLPTVQNWASGTYANNGIGIQSTSYVIPGNTTSLDAYDFYLPTLTVTYH